MPNNANTATTITMTMCSCEPDEPFCSCLRPFVVNDQPVPDSAIPFDPFTRSWA